MYQLKYEQMIPITLQECWDFFSCPTNLKIITPSHLKFEFATPYSECKMYAGQIISYHITPLWNISLDWVTEITHVQEPHYFIDEQRFGPYKFWHHEHRFEQVANGVKMKDLVNYQLPFGFLGKLAHTLKVEKELSKIFSYRREKLKELFGCASPNKN